MTADFVDSLGPMRATWDELATSTPTSHPQYLLDWLEPWWDHLGSETASFCSVVITEGGETVALAPLVLIRRQARGVVTVRELRWLAMGATDQSDILSRQAPRKAGLAVGEHLCAGKARWDELHLACVPQDSESCMGMLEALRNGMKCDVAVRRDPSFFIDTSSADWAAYLLTTSKKFVRRDLPRVRRRIAELGDARVVRESNLDVDDFLAMASVVHKARQDELGRESLFSSSAYRSFVREAFRRLGKRGAITAWLLRVDQRVAAYLVGLEFRGVFYAWNMAFDPAFGGVSPGKALWASAIEGCFEDAGIREFNMMRGDTAYKSKWTQATRDLLDIRVRNMDTPRSRMLNRLRRPAS